MYSSNQVQLNPVYMCPIVRSVGSASQIVDSTPAPQGATLDDVTMVIISGVVVVIIMLVCAVLIVTTVRCVLRFLLPFSHDTRFRSAVHFLLRYCYLAYKKRYVISAVVYFVNTITIVVCCVQYLVLSCKRFPVKPGILRTYLLSFRGDCFFLS